MYKGGTALLILSCFTEKVAASAADADSTKQQNHTVSAPLATEDKTSKASPHPGITETERSVL